MKESHLMRDHLRRLLQRASPQLRRRLLGICLFLLAFNSITWLGVVFAARTHPVLLGLAALAYGFGLRHAVDPDHIAAIDNTTRKLMQEGKRPVGVGFFFSLGHSTIVVALSALVALSASFVQRDLPALKQTGSLVGTSISCLFLLVIGTINLLVLLDIMRAWRGVVKGEGYDEQAVTDYLENRGLLARLFKPLLRLVSNSWNMYPVGVLFGLGFDTASEVGLLSISAATGAAGIPVWQILLLPLAFTAGMSLIDTLDGIMMLGAYGWAFIAPVRKLYYNMNITLISVVVALFIGGIEGLQVISGKTGASGGLWAVANDLPFDKLGYVIVGAFAVSWMASMVVYKLRRYELLEVVVEAMD
jgi:high-affinity nickel-transport protein